MKKVNVSKTIERGFSIVDGNLLYIDLHFFIGSFFMLKDTWNAVVLFFPVQIIMPNGI